MTLPGTAARTMRDLRAAQLLATLSMRMMGEPRIYVPARERGREGGGRKERKRRESGEMGGGMGGKKKSWGERKKEERSVSHRAGQSNKNQTNKGRLIVEGKQYKKAMTHQHPTRTQGFEGRCISPKRMLRGKEGRKETGNCELIETSGSESSLCACRTTKADTPSFSPQLPNSPQPPITDTHPRLLNSKKKLTRAHARVPCSSVW